MMPEAIERVEREVEYLAQHDRLKENILSVEPATNGWDGWVELSHLGRSDLKELHEFCDDWEVQAQQPADGAVIIGVDINGLIPMGADR